ncbi:MAG: D,D-heptose 1,7-bisphosphate phosphatase [Arcobacter sp.]|nr:MAG: D,D-heptose 1,7-bisphosphate phosphatase [Arcobacter sp.]
MLEKAVFLDRDGVINIEKNYLHKIKDFEFIPGLFSSLQYLLSLDYKLFIITNQSGIGREYYKQKDFDILTSWMLEELEKHNIKISQVELCPHSPNQECKCRKPKTLMIDNILKKHSIDLSNSWLIGDKSSDIKCALNAGILNTIQVKSGHDFIEKDSLAQYVCNSIADIKSIIKI